MGQRRKNEAIVKKIAIMPHSPAANRSPHAFRSSQRLTITLAQSTLEALIQRSTLEGRSVSNLAAYLLESSIETQRP
jgi:hypothetical protein